MRRYLRPLHRWLGLTLGCWFAAVGLTGSVLVWHQELDQALNPVLQGQVAVSPLPPSAVLEALAAHRPQARPLLLMAPDAHSRHYVVWALQDPGSFWRGTEYRQYYLDPGSGALLAERSWGAALFDRLHLINTLYALHSHLLLGEIGSWAVGLGGLFLLLSVGMGVTLAWPRRRQWRRVLGVKWRAAPVRRWWDLHRAGGLWLALPLLVLAVSGLYLSFPQAFTQATAALLPFEAPPRARSVALPGAADIGPDRAVALAQAALPGARWQRIGLPSGPDSVYEVRLIRPGDLWQRGGGNRVWLDRYTGAPLWILEARRQRAGNTFIHWQFPLHSGEALGLAGRVLWTLAGLLPLLLLVSGFAVWRRTRRHATRS